MASIGRSTARVAVLFLVSITVFTAYWLASPVSISIDLLSRVALILGATGIPTPTPEEARVVANEYIGPTLGGGDISRGIVVTTPQKGWPITATGNFGRSVEVGIANLETAIAQHTGSPLLIAGPSQGAMIATAVKRKLALSAKKNPDKPVPDVNFAFIASLNRPNGGLLARFPGLYVPYPIDIKFTGAAPTDTKFETVDIAAEYDGFADFPLYPLNPVATLNAIMGILYVHANSIKQASLDPSSSKFVHGTYMQKYGDTTFYHIPTHDLPLLGPLRWLGVPEPLLQLVEAPLRYLADLGYDRSIPLGKPTAARWLPLGSPLGWVVSAVQIMHGLVEATLQGVKNARESLNCGWCKPPEAYGLRPLPPGTKYVTSADVPADRLPADIVIEVAPAIANTIAPQEHRADRKAVPHESRDIAGEGAHSEHSVKAAGEDVAVTNPIVKNWQSDDAEVPGSIRALTGDSPAHTADDGAKTPSMSASGTRPHTSIRPPKTERQRPDHRVKSGAGVSIAVRGDHLVGGAGKPPMDKHAVSPHGRAGARSGGSHAAGAPKNNARHSG